MKMKYNNVYFINGTAYAGKSTMVKLLAEKYNEFLNSGFNVILRDEKRTIEETFALVEKMFKL